MQRGDVVLTLSPNGLADSRHPHGEIPWSDIRDVDIWGRGKPRQVILRLSEAYMQKNHPKFLGKLNRLGNRIFDADGLLVPQYPFKVNAEDLRDLIRAYADRYS
jgi:hypothetical protein